ncbi:30S ribosomal protein S13 [Candidatus Woesebacteria bacterium]|nr:30S ribosomal protein S13 [Candidatus Woesebacteria bacterium]|tara:strand:- start:76 stop:495 length:420 start_codon:yes stop_codon:yes gene_type:complete
MPRIAGIDLPENKKIDFSLTKLYGIGWNSASDILEKAKISPDKRTKDLTEEEIATLTKVVDSYAIEGDLRRSIRQNVQRLQDIGSYRGVRHNRGLPARGQRTRTNARSRRGKRQTVGAFKKEALAKMSPQGTKTEGEAK